MYRKTYFFFLLATTLVGCSDRTVTLENSQLQIIWADNSDGWRIDKLSIRESVVVTDVIGIEMGADHGIDVGRR